MPEAWRVALTAWNFAPSVLIGTALIAAGYLAALGPLRRRFVHSEPERPAQTRWFMLGLLVIFFALVSPLDVISDEYLLSAHMIQHILLTLVGPPLLLIGLPAWMLRPFLSQPVINRATHILTNPVLAFSLFNGVFLIWHVPALYEAAMENELVHVIEHLSFMATAVLAWWPILSPLPEFPRLPYPAQVLFLFLQSLPTTLLGALVTFAPEPLYPAYISAERVFSISVLTDQELAGLIMWMPGGMIYLVALTLIFFQWMRKNEQPYDGQRDLSQVRRIRCLFAKE